MKLLWLGQSGLLFDFNGLKIMIDPYLTDSLSKVDSDFVRKTKLNRKLFRAKPDIIILTNCHLDHADNASIEKLLKHIGKKNRTTILSCESVYDEITTIPSMAHANHIMLEKYSEWTVGDINIQAVPAKTDDKTAFGVVITDFASGKKYYIAGDTLYNKQVIDNLPSDIYAAFLPINGEFGSMNVTDAKRFAEKIQARFCVPVHFGMFDKIKPSTFDVSNAIIPKPYKIINFDDHETNEAELENESEESDQITPEGGAVNIDTHSLEYDEPEVLESEMENKDYNSASMPIQEESVQNDINENSDIIKNVCEIEANLESEFIDEGESFSESENTSSDDASAENEVNCDNEPAFENEVESQEKSEAEEAIIEEAFIQSEDSYGDFTADNFSEAKCDTTTRKMDDSDKIDAYIREIEKFERGETTDFAAIDDNE